MQPEIGTMYFETRLIRDYFIRFINSICSNTFLLRLFADSSLTLLKNLAKVDPSPLSQSEVEAATLSHIGIVCDVVGQSHKNRLHTEQHMLKHLEEEWLSAESHLTQERGLWGPPRESPLTKVRDHS